MSAFFSDHGVRETIESILVAIILAFLFKTFQAEAFVIPTGSMAPTLRGEHYDVECRQCEHRFQTGYFPEARVTRIYCPMCRFPHLLKPRDDADDNPFDGDRILVNKFLFDFAAPQRWDVIVFKNPKNAKQNYIKRLVGLPHDGLLIEAGDLYTFDRRSESFDDRQIARKSPRKARAMMQLVDDTRFIGRQLQAAQWPSRWQEWGRGDGAWTIHREEGEDSYALEAQADGSMRWLRYRHFLPTPADWDELKGGDLPERVREPGQAAASGLILDHYSYNDSNSARLNRPGLHWVGDVGFEAQLEIASDSGTIALDTVEGGVHLQCAIDVASGEARVTANGSSVTLLSPAGEAVAEASGATRIRGRGTHRLRWMNADDRLFLWVDDRAVDFHGQPFVDFRRDGDVVPRWSGDDPGDAQPLGLGSRGAALRVQRLQVFRDVYYASIREQRRPFEYRVNANLDQVLAILNDPTRWSTPEARTLFASRRRTADDLFELGDDQFLPMGDNSPSSLDARYWSEPAHVTREQLLGRALFIYFPHSWNRPVPFFPDFSRMQFIR